MSIRTELEALRKRHRGLLRPEQVVRFARENPESALHRSFDWDDSTAAEKWRLHIARNIIRVHVTVLQDDTEPVRAYVSLSQDRKSRNGYRAVASVLQDPELREQMLDEARQEFERFRKKYKALKELAPVFAAYDKTQKPKRKRKATASAR